MCYQAISRAITLIGTLCIYGRSMRYGKLENSETPPPVIRVHRYTRLRRGSPGLPRPHELCSSSPPIPPSSTQLCLGAMADFSSRCIGSRKPRMPVLRSRIILAMAGCQGRFVRVRVSVYVHVYLHASFQPVQHVGQLLLLSGSPPVSISVTISGCGHCSKLTQPTRRPALAMRALRVVWWRKHPNCRSPSRQG